MANLPSKQGLWVQLGGIAAIVAGFNGLSGALFLPVLRNTTSEVVRKEVSTEVSRELRVITVRLEQIEKQMEKHLDLHEK